MLLPLPPHGAAQWNWLLGQVVSASVTFGSRARKLCYLHAAQHADSPTR